LGTFAFFHFRKLSRLANRRWLELLGCLLVPEIMHEKLISKQTIIIYNADTGLVFLSIAVAVIGLLPQRKIL
jgi:hypothetical protein